MTASAAFEVVPAYWPAGSGIFWWENFSLAEVRRDFDTASSLGLSTLAISLSWSDFQPSGRGVAATAMRSLEATLQGADDARLRLRLSLLPAQIGSLLWLPGWTLVPASQGQRMVLAGHHLSSWAVRDLYRDSTLREAQARLIGEITGEFGSHPAAAAWLLADRVPAALPPDSAGGFRDWLALLVDSVGRDARPHPLWCGISARDLILSRLVDVSTFGELGVSAQVVADWQPSWAPDSPDAWLLFLAAFAGRVGGAPAAIALTRAGDSFDAESAGTAVHGGGASACCLPALFELSTDAVRPLPAADRDGFTHALVAASGGPTAVGEAWLGLARANPAALPIPDQMSEIDPEQRLRDPEAVAREAFTAFNL